MPRFFAEITEYSKATITDQRSVRHISGPLRKKKGDILSIRDLSKGYEARICSLESRLICLDILSDQELLDRCSRQIHLGMSLIDLKDMEDVIRYAAELGAADIYPVVSGRSNVRSVSHARQKRFQEIVLEAVKQCERKSIPPVHEVHKLEEFVHDLSSPWEERLVAAQGGEEISFENRKTETGILIGPEGGFTPEETGMIIQAGFIPVSLGRTTLRAVTAAVAALSILGV